MAFVLLVLITVPVMGIVAALVVTILVNIFYKPLRRRMYRYCRLVGSLFLSA